MLRKSILFLAVVGLCLSSSTADAACGRVRRAVVRTVAAPFRVARAVRFARPRFVARAVQMQRSVVRQRSVQSAAASCPSGMCPIQSGPLQGQYRIQGGDWTEQ